MASSWLKIDPNSPFSLDNIPFGIISTSSNPKPRPAIAIGDFALDLDVFTVGGGFENSPVSAKDTWVFSQSTLNAFASLGQAVHGVTRKYLQDVFTAGGSYDSVLENNQALREKALYSLKEIRNHLPMAIGDYTDFYAGKNHAYNVGVMFRGPENALQPNYTHLPVGYHGRASSVIISGTPIARPSGQILPLGQKTPLFTPSQKLDIELELAAFVCKENPMGTSIPINTAKEYIFGLVLMNDWSARDIQAWEYVPLGPFLSKSFATSISPWIVLSCALEPFLTTGLEPGDRESLLPYLREERKENVYDMELEVAVVTERGNRAVVTRTNGRNLLYSFPQMLAHHSVNGCPMRVGDLLGSGTISGVTGESLGSFLEKTGNGKVAVQVGGGEERLFLQDGDEVIIEGVCGKSGHYVGFGSCVGKIV